MPATPPLPELSRRGFLAAGTAAAATAMLPAAALATASRSANRDILGVMLLRGGADGLALCIPHGDPYFRAHRPGAPAHAIDLDGFFGLPAELAPLHDLYRRGHLAVVHAAGSSDTSRSHFLAQRCLESGGVDPDVKPTGWLGRHLGMTPGLRSGAAVNGVRGVSIGTQPHLTLVGAPRARRSSEVDLPDGRPGLAGAFDQALHLIQANGALEAITIDQSGWDTHREQFGSGSTGTISASMRELGTSLREFYDRVCTVTRRPITVVALSEFGRTVALNDCGGTDHGHGGVVFCLGRHIRGGRVHGRWPGLAPECLQQGSALAATTDVRDVLAEILHKRCGCRALGEVFPGHAPALAGIVGEV